MSNGEFERMSGRFPDMQLLFYENEIVEGEGRGSGDRYIALEKFIANELEIDETMAARRIHTSGFIEEITTIQELPFIEADRHRLETEMYTLAPLLLVWRDVRNLRPYDEAEAWLNTAVKLALSKSGDHQDDSCEAIEATRDYCDLSGRCPVRTTLRVLSEHALGKSNDDLEAFLQKENQFELVRKELQLASEYGLITDGLAFDWFRRYDLRKQGKIVEAEEESSD